MLGSELGRNGSELDSELSGNRWSPYRQRTWISGGDKKRTWYLVGSWIWTSCTSHTFCVSAMFSSLPHPCCPWIWSSLFLFLFVLLSLHNLYGPWEHLYAHCWGYLTIAMSCWTFWSPLHLLKRHADVALFCHAVGTDICVCRHETMVLLRCFYEIIYTITDKYHGAALAPIC